MNYEIAIAFIGSICAVAAALLIPMATNLRWANFNVALVSVVLWIEIALAVTFIIRIAMVILK